MRCCACTGIVPAKTDGSLIAIDGSTRRARARCDTRGYNASILQEEADALVLLFEGEADISIAGTPHRVAAGQLLRLPAGRPHAVKAVTRFKMLLTMIRA